MILDPTKIDWSSTLGKQIDAAIGGSNNYKAEMWNYDPYTMYTQVNGDLKDDTIQKLLDKISDEKGNAFRFVDVSPYFRGSTPIVLTLPATQQLTFDMYGNPQWPENGEFKYLDADGSLKTASLSELKLQGYDYQGYGSEKGTKLDSRAL
jgi:hypothetical protein